MNTDAYAPMKGEDFAVANAIRWLNYTMQKELLRLLEVNADKPLFYEDVIKHATRGIVAKAGPYSLDVTVQEPTEEDRRVRRMRVDVEYKKKGYAVDLSIPLG